MKFELYCDLAPRTCKNFLALAASEAYNGTKFHRVMRGFIAQVRSIARLRKCSMLNVSLNQLRLSQSLSTHHNRSYAHPRYCFTAFYYLLLGRRHFGHGQGRRVHLRPILRR